MWKSKKFIVTISVVAAVVVLVGAGVGVAFAADNPPVQTGQSQMMARVAQILGVEQSKVEAAFKQAAKEIATARLDQFLKNQVDNGKITQQQADQYKQWLQSRPDVPLPGRDGLKGPRFQK